MTRGLYHGDSIVVSARCRKKSLVQKSSDSEVKHARKECRENTARKHVSVGAAGTFSMIILLFATSVGFL